MSISFLIQIFLFYCQFSHLQNRDNKYLLSTIYGFWRKDWKLNLNFLSHYLEAFIYDYSFVSMGELRLTWITREFALMRQTQIQINHFMYACIGASAFSYNVQLNYFQQYESTAITVEIILATYKTKQENVLYHECYRQNVSL